MNESYKQGIRQYVSEFHLPRYQELPDFGLRLEQVVKFAGKYAPMPLTGSMVSNYVKQKIIPSPVKKSYGPDSIAYLIFVSYIKCVMPLEDIREFMQVQRSSYALDVAYNYFCEEFENLLQFVVGLKDAPDRIGRSSTPQKELLRTALLSITYKVYMDQYWELYRQSQQEEALPQSDMELETVQ